MFDFPYALVCHSRHRPRAALIHQLPGPPHPSFIKVGCQCTLSPTSQNCESRPPCRLRHQPPLCRAVEQVANFSDFVATYVARKVANFFSFTLLIIFLRLFFLSRCRHERLISLQKNTETYRDGENESSRRERILASWGRLAACGCGCFGGVGWLVIRKRFDEYC